MGRKHDPTWKTDITTRLVHADFHKAVCAKVLESTQPVLLSTPSKGEAVRLRVDFYIWRKTETEVLHNKQYMNIRCSLRPPATGSSTYALEFSNTSAAWMVDALRAAGVPCPDKLENKPAVLSRFVPDHILTERRTAQEAAIRQALTTPKERAELEALVSGLEYQAPRSIDAEGKTVYERFVDGTLGTSPGDKPLVDIDPLTEPPIDPGDLA